MYKRGSLRFSLVVSSVLAAAALCPAMALAQGTTTIDTSSKSLSAPGYSSSSTTRIEETHRDAAPAPQLAPRPQVRARRGAGGGATEESVETDETITTQSAPVAPVEQTTTSRSTETRTTR